MMSTKYIELNEDEEHHTAESIFRQYFEAKENKKLHRLHCHSKPLAEDVMVMAGIPDFYYIYDGKIRFIEIKRPKDGLTYNQMIWIEKHPQYDVQLIYVDVNELPLDIETIVYGRTKDQKYQKQIEMKIKRMLESSGKMTFTQIQTVMTDQNPFIKQRMILKAFEKLKRNLQIMTRSEEPEYELGMKI